MDSQWTTFLGLGVPLLTAVFVAIFAYWKQRQAALQRYKHTLYSALQLSVFTLWASKGQFKKEIEALSSLSDAWIVASDKVLRQVNLFMQAYDNSRRDKDSALVRSKRLQPIVAELFLRMRQDLFPNTRLTPKEARNSVRFYRWVGKTSKQP